MNSGGFSIPDWEIRAMVKADPIYVYDGANGQQHLATDIVQRRDPALLQEEHKQWLSKSCNAFDAKRCGLSPLLPHDWNGLPSHYNLSGDQMLWRFTSTPSTEFVQITEDTTYEEIVRVIAAHSGGNDKSNPNVKTLSFARNLGALIGVAASPGGDKHVTNIVDKAEYLFGIDINSLASKNITAHPAGGRAISLFETEYVLVRKPGLPPISLDALATVKYRNPFKGRGWIIAGNEAQSSRGAIEAEMGTVKADQIRVMEMDPSRVKEIKKTSKKAAGLALGHAKTIRDTTLLDPTGDLIPGVVRVTADFGNKLSTS
jgi:hypothetical protein